MTLLGGYGRQVRIIITAVDNASAVIGGITSKYKAFGQNITAAGRQLTMGLTLPIAAFGVAAVKAASDYESAFVGVIKTTEGLGDNVRELTKLGQELYDAFVDLSTEIPVSAVELAGIGEIAGQLGIRAEDILKFTRVIAEIGAATNLSLEEAATSFARFSNIMQMPIKDADRLGSSLVHLGNNTATTEHEIMEMAMRVAAVGSVMGLTEDQVLGWAAAMSSVALRSMMGGTALSRAFVIMQESVSEGEDTLKLFAETAGMSIEDFAELFRVDASEAMFAFTSGLGNVIKSGGDVLGLLESLNMDQIRVRDTMLRLAKATEKTRWALDIAAEGYRENTARTIEAERRWAAFASQVTLLKNNIIAVAISFGEILIPILLDLMKTIQPVIERFQNLDIETQKIILVAGGLLAALGPVLIMVGALATVIGALASPVGLVIAGIIALTAAFVKSQGGIEPAAKTIAGLVSTLKDSLGPVLDYIRDKWDAIWPHIQKLIHTVLDDIVPFAKGMFNSMRRFFEEEMGVIKEWVDENWPLIQKIIVTVIKTIEEIWVRVWPYLQTIVITTWDSVKIIIDTTIKTILGILKLAMQIITGDWEGAWQTIQDITKTVLNGIKSLLKNQIAGFRALGGDLIEGILNGIKNAWGKVTSWLSAEAAKLPDWVKGPLGIHSPSAVFAEIGLDMMLGFAKGIDAGQVRVVEKISKSLKKIMEAFQIFGGLQFGGMPTVEEVKNYLGQFRQMIDTIIIMLEDIDRVVGYKRLKTLQKDSRKLQYMFEAVIQDFSAIKLYDLPNMTEWREQFYSVAESVCLVIQHLSDTLGSAALGEAAASAEFIEKIVRVIIPAVDALTTLATYEKIGGLPAKAKQMAADLKETLQALIDIGTTWGEEAVKNTALFATSAITVVGIVTPAVNALISLATYVQTEDISTNAEQMAKDLAIALQAIIDISGIWKDEALTNAVAFSEAAIGAVKVIAPAITALTALATYERLENTSEAITGLQGNLSIVLAALKSIGDAWKNVDLTNAIVFSETVTGVVGFIQPAVDALTALAKYERIKDVKGAISGLQGNLSVVLAALKSIGDAWKNVDMTGAVAFSKTVTDVVGMIEPAIDALTALGEYTTKDIPAAMRAFLENLSAVITGIRNATTLLDVDAATAASDFLSSAQTLHDAVIDGINLILFGDGYAVDLSGVIASAKLYLTQLANHVEGILSRISSAFANARNSVANSISGIINNIWRLQSALDGLHAPDLVLMHSPPPLAQSFYMIADAIAEVRRGLSLPWGGLVTAGAPIGSATTTSDSHDETYVFYINGGDSSLAGQVLDALKLLQMGTESA